METFSVLLAILVGEFTGDQGQWRGVLIFFGLRLNKRLSKQ